MRTTLVVTLLSIVALVVGACWWRGRRHVPDDVTAQWLNDHAYREDDDRKF